MKLKCKNCKVDLKKGGVTYVEDGVMNCINYTFNELQKIWFVDSETDGDNPTECYYICRQCGERLTDKQREYFGDNI